ncbi:MAG: peptidoglycan synthetase [Sphingobacteriales bacterium]|nr:MAG: peptidoglycan synthetase [Sphingobacteriales bacterium]TAF78229.1 MAG: peptidoglycan synthetase [Sphingobacteriales bacterium]
MRVHFIAIGGAAMHNLAIALKIKGFTVSGSDDLITEPSKSRLLQHQLLPDYQGWDEAKITTDIDAIILGMHARVNNPELLKAQQLGIRIYSYPEYIYAQSENKTRVVIGGSHGKTTITSMILHTLKYFGKDFDYLVGAQIEGFDNMVKLSDAPIIVIEGDEYLASPIDRRPKFHIYQPHIAIISGIAWDHINVFPTFENYIQQFDLFIDTIKPNGTLIYCTEDKVVNELINHKNSYLQLLPYSTPKYVIKEDVTYLTNGDSEVSLKIFGQHNLQNLNAAKLACLQLGIAEADYYTAISSFKGAARRLEIVSKNKYAAVFKDFAHSPSKLIATIAAVKQQYPGRKLIACIELHTFSSLNKKFLNEYKNTMNQADLAIVYINNTTFEHKGLKSFTKNQVIEAFNKKDLILINNPHNLLNYLISLNVKNTNLLMMSSGNFDSLNIIQLSDIFLENSTNKTN